MRIGKILPCVCSVPVDLVDSCRNGMPILVVSAGEYYSAYCPKCGRGTELPYCKSAFLALKDWNATQRSCYHIAGVREAEIDYNLKYKTPHDDK